MNKQRICVLLFILTGFLFGFKAKSVMGWYDFLVMSTLFILGAVIAAVIQSIDDQKKTMKVEDK